VLLAKIIVALLDGLLFLIAHIFGMSLPLKRFRHDDFVGHTDSSDADTDHCEGPGQEIYSKQRKEEFGEKMYTFVTDRMIEGKLDAVEASLT
jgi:hypothetical protein